MGEFDIGDYVKARFWPGERIWARIINLDGEVIHATIANEPASSLHRLGDPVSCSADEVLEHMKGTPQ